ncbi:hypothetical protein ACO2Q3_04370 [Caulobacter sp. KR2-114]|uniref:hypothetical protein n=1 Tax=Caulobacter sp. KR2-114 TaxID=3400912 RepID=UPI003C011C98
MTPRFAAQRLALTLIALAAAGLTLAACGKVGELDRPGPMWGAKAKADWAAQQKAAADAEARKDAHDQSQRGHPEPLPSPDSAPSDGPSAPQRPQ